jgi:competence CoiA-like predicted nuclease
MAFDAFDKIGQHIDISDGIDPSVNIHDDFYCCGCHCILHIKAVDSNKRAAHFAGKHELWCNDASTSQENDRISDYGLKNGFLQKLLETVQTEGVKKPSESTSHVSHTTAASSGNGTARFGA